MEDIAKGVLAGIALGSFAAVMVKANMIASKALLELNCLAIDMAFVMGHAAWSEIKLRRRWRQLEIQIVGERERTQADDEDES